MIKTFLVFFWPETKEKNLGDKTQGNMSNMNHFMRRYLKRKKKNINNALRHGSPH